MVYPRTDAASAGHSRFGTDESGSDFLLPFDGEGATAEIDRDGMDTALPPGMKG